jgi:UDP-N-acetylmuramyl pentapeptide phosphotransferase/UDP-N-acetylglucosamine-1-phosphate transferase
MIAPAWALLLATGLLALGDATNRRWFGFLPDDPPRPGRKQHARPIPLAGVLLLPAVLPWLIAERSWYLLAAACLATALGFGDDREKERGEGLDWRIKGIGLLFAAALAATAVANPLAAPATWAAAALLVFVLTNATNFLDNTDGVAAALSATSLLLLGSTFGGGWQIAAGCAALAFVPWNWPTPRLFLGDSGAYLLGLLVGAGVSAPTMANLDALLMVAVQLADFAQVIVARLWIGHPPWVGDRRHLTHIAQNLRLPRRLVAPTFAVIAMVVGWLAQP